MYSTQVKQNAESKIPNERIYAFVYELIYMLQLLSINVPFIIAKLFVCINELNCIFR